MKELICIVCPNGCNLIAEDADGKITVKGNKCAKGENFALTEMTAPVRSLSTTVRTVFDEFPVIPVKTSGEVSKNKIMEIMDEISKIVIDKPVPAGYVLVENVCQSGANIIVTSNCLLNERNVI